MSLSVHTFETKPTDPNLNFSFHESIGEGQELFFIARFPEKTKDSKTIANSIFGVIVNVFQSSKIKDTYDKLEEALKNANLEYKKFAAQIPDVPDIIIAHFDFNNLYLSQSGGSEAYLLRDSKISQISETPERGEELFLNILNGQVSIEDTIILTTRRVLRYMTSNQLIDIFSRSNFSQSSKSLRQELSNAGEEDFLVTIIGIGKTDETPAAGFLSRVMQKKKKSVPSPSNTPKESESLAIKTNASVIKEEVNTEESIAPEPHSKKTIHQPIPNPSDFIKDLFSKIKRSNWNALSNSQKLVPIAGLLFGVFIIVITVQLLWNFESEETLQLREQLSIARESLQQADTFLLQGDRPQAAEYLKKSKSAVQSILKSKSKNFRSDAQFLLADIQEKQLQVENARKVTPHLLADLGVKNDAVDPIGIMELKGNLFVFDFKNIYKTIRNIVEKGFPISEKENIIAGVSRKDQNTILFVTDGPRIIEYRDGVISPMNTSDGTWKRGLDIQPYGRFSYILDPVENQIWKYERRRDKYSGAIPYNQGADLSRAISFAIDGAIYLLNDDGTIQKLFRGEKVKYNFRDLPSVGFEGKNLKIFTRTDLDFLYVLDPDNARVLVFVKGDRFATYKKQVLFDIPNARDFSVDELGQRINLLIDDKIYEFSL